MCGAGETPFGVLLRIGLAYNQRPPGVDTTIDPTVVSSLHGPIDVYVEWDEPETIAAVADALRPFGEVVHLEALDDFPERLADAKVDFLFNMAEGLHGPTREAHVPAIAEFLNVPYLGSDPLTLGLALHKARAKDVLIQLGVPTPPYLLIQSAADLPALESFDCYPVFLKPAWEGSSKGIAEANRAVDTAAAQARAEELLDLYDEPVLVEPYLTGDEFTVAVLGNGVDARCLPLIRYRFDILPDGAVPIMGYEAKWLWDQPGTDFQVLECPAQIDNRLAAQIHDTALAAYRALGCRDWSRVDIRLDAHSYPQVLELNPLPGVIPDPDANSCFPWAADAAGMSYETLIQEVTRVAWRRVTGNELLIPSPVRAVS